MASSVDKDPSPAIPVLGWWDKFRWSQSRMWVGGAIWTMGNQGSDWGCWERSHGRHDQYTSG